MDELEKEFFKFVYKRQLIWYKRFILHQSPPWTDDEVLKTYKIINVYRELDKCTIYLIEKLRRIKEREKVLLNIIFYRFFNQTSLYEKLEIEPFSEIDKSLKIKLIRAFDRIHKEGRPIFNNAYLITSGGKNKKKHISILDNLQAVDISRLVIEIDLCKSPEEALQTIQKIPMVGPFLACEIWTDLSYFNFFVQNWTDNDFVNIGPGATWGLEILCNKKLNKKEQKDLLSQLWKEQEDALKNIHVELGQSLCWRDIAFKDAFSNYPFLSITNVEGALCEFRKYWNISHGKGRRKYFYPLKY